MGIFKKVLTAGEGKKLKLLQAIVPAREHARGRVSGPQRRRPRREDRRVPQPSREVVRTSTTCCRRRSPRVREAAERVIGQRHFDVQLMGGAALHQGWIAEMKTGEGKTLTATLAVYLNALSGEGVHVVTVNDYLAKRDSEWMGQVYRFLGAQTGLIQAQMSPAERRPAYEADITYGTNNEFGFDYLRDNMVTERGAHGAARPLLRASLTRSTRSSSTRPARR